MNFYHPATLLTFDSILEFEKMCGLDSGWWKLVVHPADWATLRQGSQATDWREVDLPPATLAALRQSSKRPGTPTFYGVYSRARIYVSDNVSPGHSKALDHKGRVLGYIKAKAA